MEIVVNNKLLDIIRVEYGLLLRVEKFDVLRKERVIPNGYIDNKDLKRVTGADMSRFKEVKKDILSSEGEVILEKGSFVYQSSSRDDYEVIKPLTNPQEFYYSVKCSGGTIEGWGKNCTGKLKKINSIMTERYGM